MFQANDSRRGRLQFSLGTMFIALTVFAVVAATMPGAIELYRDWREPGWEDVGGPGTILPFQNTIACSFDPVDEADLMAIESLPNE